MNTNLYTDTFFIDENYKQILEKFNYINKELTNLLKIPPYNKINILNFNLDNYLNLIPTNYSTTRNLNIRKIYEKLNLTTYDEAELFNTWNAIFYKIREEIFSTTLFTHNSSNHVLNNTLISIYSIYLYNLINKIYLNVLDNLNINNKDFKTHIKALKITTIFIISRTKKFRKILDIIISVLNNHFKNTNYIDPIISSPIFGNNILEKKTENLMVEDIFTVSKSLKELTTILNNHFNNLTEDLLLVLNKIMARLDVYNMDRYDINYINYLSNNEKRFIPPEDYLEIFLTISNNIFDYDDLTPYFYYGIESKYKGNYNKNLIKLKRYEVLKLISNIRFTWKYVLNIPHDKIPSNLEIFNPMELYGYKNIKNIKNYRNSVDKFYTMLNILTTTFKTLAKRLNSSVFEKGFKTIKELKQDDLLKHYLNLSLFFDNDNELFKFYKRLAEYSITQYVNHYGDNDEIISIISPLSNLNIMLTHPYDRNDIENLDLIKEHIVRHPVLLLEDNFAHFMKIDPNLSLREKRKIIKHEKMKKYSKVKELAKFAVEYELDHNEINDYYKLYKKNKKKSFKNPLKLSYKENKFKIEILDKHDPFQMFVGLETRCCQHLHSAGDDCVYHVMTKDDSYILGWFLDNKLIAQAWCYVEDNVFVLDSIESIYKHLIDNIIDLLDKFTDKLLNETEIKRVHIGYSNFGLTGSIIEKLKLKKTKSVKLKGYDGYTDADKQVLYKEIEK